MSDNKKRFDTYGNEIAKQVEEWKVFQQRTRDAFSAQREMLQFLKYDATRKASAHLPQCEVVEWFCQGVKIRGTLWIPPFVDINHYSHNSKKLDGLILCHGWGGLRAHLDVKYAYKIVQEGIVCLTFDYRTWGDSDGVVLPSNTTTDAYSSLQNRARAEDLKGQNIQQAQIPVLVLRNQVNMTWNLQDIDSAVTFLSSKPFISSNIAIWGTSQGGGHVLFHAARDARVKLVISQAPSLGKNGAGSAFLHQAENVRKQNLDFVLNGSNNYPSGSSAFHLPAMDGSPHLQDLAYYDPLASVSNIKCPTLIIDAREEDLWDVKDNGLGAFNGLSESLTKKKYVTLEGTHYDIYGKASAEAIKEAISFLHEHFPLKKVAASNL